MNSLLDSDKDKLSTRPGRIVQYIYFRETNLCNTNKYIMILNNIKLKDSMNTPSESIWRVIETLFGMLEGMRKGSI